MKNEGRKSTLIKTVFAVVLVAAAVVCVCRRVPECFSSQNPAALAAAAFTLTDGTYKINENSNTEKPASKSTAIVKQTPTQSVEKATIPEKKVDKSDYYDSYSDHNGETKHEIAEKTYGADGTKCDSCYVKNKTGLDIDFDSLLKDSLTFSVKKNTSSPQVLIYHTHTSEGYIDEDVNFFYESFYSRTQNNDFNVVAVGNAITNALDSKDITTLHDKTVHDSTYNGSYDRSVVTVQNDMKKNKDIKVVLDIHRDAIGTDDCKIKPVFTYNGKKAAQIMILSGCDTDGERGFTHWKNNLNFALKIQNKAEQMYPGITRPLDFDYFAYNEYVCDGSLLIEIGTDANSTQEAQYAGTLLGNVIAEVLK